MPVPLSWPSARIPTTLSLDAAVSFRKKPVPVARRILSFARTVKQGLTARRRNALPRQKIPPRSSAQRLSLWNWTEMRILKFAPPTQSNWRASSAGAKPGVVLAPSLVENQHPDHPTAGTTCARCVPARPLWRRQGIAPDAGSPDWAIILLRGDARSRASQHHASAH